MRSFTLNGQFNSHANFGIRILEPVAIPTTARVVDEIEVVGRAGTLTRETGWANQTITIRCAITDKPDGSRWEALSALRAVLAGSLPGIERADRLELSNKPGCYYQIAYAAMSEVTKLTSQWWEFTLTFTCAPFTYLSGIAPITLTGSGSVVNPGFVFAEPVITVYGTGTLTLTINSTTHTVKAPGGQVTIDSARKLCHVAGRVQTDALIGDFPILQPMANQITLGAGISKIVIVPNWRNP